jgi:hypothetical protein
MQAEINELSHVANNIALSLEVPHHAQYHAQLLCVVPTLINRNNEDYNELTS